MNNNDKNKSTVFGLLTDEFQSKKDLFEVCIELGIKPIEVNRALNDLKRTGAVVMKDTGNGILVKAVGTTTPSVTPETIKVTSETKVTPIKTVGKYGTTKQIDSKGQEFDYIRSEFDGQEGKLSHEHEIKKHDLIMFKSVLRKIVPSLNGIGDVAITMYQPDISTRDDGKVFYRWDNPSKTEDLIDELHKLIEPMLQAMPGSE